MDDEIREAMEAYIQGQSDFQNANALSIESLEKSKKGYDGLTDKQRDAVRSTQAFTAGLKRTLSDFRTNAGRVSAFGGVVDGVGVGLRKMGFAGHMAAEALEAIAGLTFEEVDRTMENFDKMATIGAIGAQGMEGFRVTANNAGLTMEQFARVVTQSSQSLAIGTGSTLAGSKALQQMAEVAGASGLTLQLRMLGQSVEEQQEFQANYLFLQRRIGRTAVTDYRAQTAAAGEYTKHLLALSAITGKSVKEEQAALDAQLRNQRFRFALQGTDNAMEIQATMRILQERLGPISDGLMDAFSGPNTEGAREAMVTFGRVPGGLLPLIERFKQGEVSAGEFTQQLYEAGKSFKADLGPTVGLIAGSGSQLSGAASEALIGIEQIGDIDPKLFAEYKKSLELLASGSSELTKNLAESALNSQKTAVEAEKIADIFLNIGNNILPGFSSAILTATEMLDDFTKFLGFGVEGRPEGRASGGPVSPGKPYLVGEEGPELVQFADHANIVDAARTRNVQEQIAKLFSDPEMIRDGFETAMGEFVTLVEGGAEGVRIAGAQGTSYYDTQGNFLKQVMPSLVEGLTQTYYADGSIQQRYSNSGLNIIDLFGAEGAAKSRRSEYVAGGMSFVQEQDFQTGETRSRGYYQDGTFGRAEGKLMYEQDRGFASGDFKVMKEMVDALYKIADNTAAGADNSKKLLRASSS